MSKEKPVSGISKELVMKFPTFKKWEAYCNKMNYINPSPKEIWEKFHDKKVILKKK